MEKMLNHRRSCSKWRRRRRESGKSATGQNEKYQQYRADANEGQTGTPPVSFGDVLPMCILPQCLISQKFNYDYSKLVGISLFEFVVKREGDSRIYPKVHKDQALFLRSLSMLLSVLMNISA